MIRLGLFVASLLLVSCSHMTEKECQNADWFVIGKRDAARGDDNSNLSEYANSCAKQGGVNLERFEAGRYEGLREFCTEEKGYHYAREGNEYAGGCPRSQKGGFWIGYERGRRDYKAAEKAAQLKAKEEELKKKERELEEKEEELKRKERG